MELTIRRLTAGNFAIDNGSGDLLDACPCCGKTMTQEAACAVVVSIEEGKLTFDQARKLVQLAWDAEISEATWPRQS